MARPGPNDRSAAVLWISTIFGAFFLLDTFGGLELPRHLMLHPQALMRALEVLPSAPADGAAWWAVATVWTSVLVHGDLWHLLYNVAYFWFFGTLLSHVTGDRGVVLALLVTSLTAGVAFVLRNPDAAGVVGASGAISGVAGFYCLIAFRWDDAPDAHAWPLARPVAPIQAALVAIVAVALDLYVMRSGMADGVARDAHIGGFGGGLVLGALLTTFFPSWQRYRSSRLGPRAASR